MRRALPLLALLACLAARCAAGAPDAVEDALRALPPAAAAAARGSDWFRALRATADDAVAQRFANAGPWRVARVNASSIGSWQLRGAPIHAFAAVVFYPCAERNCGAVAANPADAAGRWPVVVFGPGWQSWALRYDRTLRHLASHGMVVLAPTTNDGRIVPHAWQFAQTMLAALQFAAAESARPGSLLESRVDSSRAGAFGHSLGGGSATTAAALANNVTRADWLGRVPRPDWPWGTASLLDFSAAADSPAWPNLRALVTLGLAPISAPLPAVSALRARTLFLVAEEDRYIYPSVQRAYFAALPASTPRTLAVLRQGTHCFLDEPQAAHWGLPASQCEMARADPARFLMPEAQVYAARKYAAAFFAATLADDRDAAALACGDAMRRDPLVTTVLAEGPDGRC